MNKANRLLYSPLLSTWYARLVRVFNRFAPRGGFKRDASVLIIGVVGAQVINLITSPIITRLYSPGQMGLLGLLMTISGIVTPMAAWRYESSIMLPDDDRDAAVLITLSVLIVIGMTFLTLLLAIWLGSGISRILNAPELEPWFWIIPILLFFSGVDQILQTWHSRVRQFRQIAAGRVSRAGATSGVQMITGWLFGGPTGGVLGGLVSGIIAETAVLFGVLRRGRAPDLRHTLDVKQLREKFARYRKFPIYAMLGGIVTGNVSLFISHFFNPTEVGYFWLSDRILALPISLIGQSLSVVFYQRLSEAAKQPTKGPQLIADVFVGSFLLAFLPLTLVALVGPQLFGFVFGSQWVMSGRFAQVMAPGYLIFFCAFPIITASFVYEKQGVTLIWQLGVFLLTGLSIWVGAFYHTSLLSIAAYTSCQVILYSLIVVLAFRWSGAAWHEIPLYSLDSARRLTRQPLEWAKRTMRGIWLRSKG